MGAAREYDGRLHPLEWAILEADREIAEEAKKAPGYLQGFFSIVELTITLITSKPQDAQFIADVVTSLGAEDGPDYAGYLKALFGYEPLVGVLALLSGVFFVLSMLGGFFFVLMRLVGALGGRKVQNITSRYMFFLRAFIVMMITLSASTVLSLVWLWGSSSRLHDAHDENKKIFHGAHDKIKLEMTNALSKLSSSLSQVREARRNLSNEIDNVQTDYLSDLQSRANDVLEQAGVPSEQSVKDLKEFCDQAQAQQQVPFKDCSDTCAVLLDYAQNATIDVQAQLQKTLNDYTKKGAQYVELDTFKRLIRTIDNDLDSMKSHLSAATFPVVSDYDILSRVSPYGGIFQHGLDYVGWAYTLAFVLQGVVIFSFVVGTWVHDPEIPPNKRSFISNQTGITLVVSTLFMWIFTTSMIPATMLYMVSGVVAANYICFPYEYNDVTGLEILDNVTKALFIIGNPQDTSSKSYSKPYDIDLYSMFQPGHIIETCNKTTPLLNRTKLSNIAGKSAVFLAPPRPKYLTFLEQNKGLKVEPQFTYPDFFPGNMVPATMAAEKIVPPPKPVTVTGSIKTAKDAKALAKLWQNGGSRAVGSPQDYRTAIKRAMNQAYLTFVLKKVKKYVDTIESVSHAAFTTTGDCQALRDFYLKCIDSFCGGVLMSMNGIWFSLWLSCVLFASQIVVGLKISKYFMKMDDYMYEGVEVEESVEGAQDDKSSGLSVSYAPSGIAAPSGQYRWRRPRYDPEGKFLKFENAPFHMPELEKGGGPMEDEDTEMDIKRWIDDKKKEFVIKTIAHDVKLAKEARKKSVKKPHPPK